VQRIEGKPKAKATAQRVARVVTVEQPVAMLIKLIATGMDLRLPN